MIFQIMKLFMWHLKPLVFGNYLHYQLVGTSVRERIIPLLQIREIYTGIGETGMAKRVHKVIIQILVLKVYISSQKLTAKRFHMSFYYGSCYASCFILWSLAILNNTLYFSSESFTQQWIFKDLFSFLYAIARGEVLAGVSTLYVFLLLIH